MARLKIGLIYNYDSNWVGGAYYIQNLVIAFSKLDERFKPEVVLFTNEDEFKNFKSITKYPRLIHSAKYERVPTFFERGINKIAKGVLNSSVTIDTKRKVNFLFPVFDINGIQNVRAESIYWIPDFQERHLPAFFPRRKLIKE